MPKAHVRSQPSAMLKSAASVRLPSKICPSVFKENNPLVLNME